MARIPVEQRSGRDGVVGGNGGRRHGAASPDGAADAPRRGQRTLASLLPAVTRSAFRRRSPVTTTVLADWAAIAGPRLAAMAAPRELRAGVLTLRCDGPAALELQHEEARLIDRVNRALGATVVRRIRLVQDAGGVFGEAPPPPARVARPAAAPVPGAPDGPLGEALARLGAVVRARTPDGDDPSSRSA